jgi:hypothetical protein
MSENIQAVIVFISICLVFVSGVSLGKDFARYEERERRREMYRHPAGKGR